MIDLLLIGIGTGNPDHLTLQAVKAISSAEVILVPLKGPEKAELANVRRRVLDRAVADFPAPAVVEFNLPRRNLSNPDYKGGVDDWHNAVAEAWRQQIVRHCPNEQGRVALLIWGDPSLYDSSLRIASRLSSKLPLNIEVIPGITSLQGLTAAHAMPLNDIGENVLITTGRKLREDGWPPAADTVAVMLDGENSFTHLDATGLTIWWGAYVGMPEEIAIAGPLTEVAAQIIDSRAAARKRMGWIMDIYILRKKPQSPAP